jgi:hypothetical protein
MSYFNKTVAMATLTASNDTILWEIPAEELDLFFEQYPHLKEYAQKVCIRRTEENASKLN